MKHFILQWKIHNIDISIIMHICIPHLYILSASMHICKSFKSYPRPWVHPESRHSPHVSCPNSSLGLHRLFSLASMFEDKTDCGDQVQDLGKQEQWSACMHTNGLLFCLFPLISCICCSLTCWKAPLSLALLFTIISFAHSHNYFEIPQDKSYTL